MTRVSDNLSESLSLSLADSPDCNSKPRCGQPVTLSLWARVNTCTRHGAVGDESSIMQPVVRHRCMHVHIACSIPDVSKTRRMHRLWQNAEWHMPHVSSEALQSYVRVEDHVHHFTSLSVYQVLHSLAHSTKVPFDSGVAMDLSVIAKLVPEYSVCALPRPPRGRILQTRPTCLAIFCLGPHV